MYLEHLSIIDYKNIAQAELLFSPNVNCFVGVNGMGKTNLLDAIHYLSFCKSSLTASDAFNLRHGAPFFLLQGDYRNADGEVERVSCACRPGTRKRLKCNDKEYRRLSEHVGKIPLVMISPSDSLLVSGGSEERRRFMDMVISQYDVVYLDALLRYDKALKQRNALLRGEAEPDASVMDVLEEMMSSAADHIYRCRCVFVEEFLPVFRSLYAVLCNCTHETVDMVYASHGHRGKFADLLRNGRMKERIVGHSLYGTHRDDLELQFGGFPVKQECSQGQTKTYFIAMKLAQYVFLKQKGEKRVPILLLDDIFDKLDAGRVGRIVDYVSGHEFGQIFITDTHWEHLDELLASTQRDYRLFTVENGTVTVRSADRQPQPEP